MFVKLSQYYNISVVEVESWLLFS